jgi:hypothetical protein
MFVRIYKYRIYYNDYTISYTRLYTETRIYLTLLI